MQTRKVKGDQEIRSVVGEAEKKVKTQQITTVENTRENIPAEKKTFDKWSCDWATVNTRFS